MKKIILLTVLTVLTSISFAQNNTSNNNANNESSAQDSSSNSGNPTLDNAMNKAKNSGGDFNSKVSNPFSFCSAPKPGKKNPMRAVWEQACPSGNTQAAPAPVPVPTGRTSSDTKALQEQFSK